VGLSYEHGFGSGAASKLWMLPKRASDRVEIERLTRREG
jgi:hypothetical protein